MNGLCKITVNGKLVNLRFGLPANRDFFNYIAINPGVIIGKEMTEMGVATLFHAAYKNACIVNNEEPVLGFGDFLAYGEDAYINEKLNAEMLKAIETWQESSYTIKYTKQVAERLSADENKKKVSTKKKPIGKK